MNSRLDSGLVDSKNGSYLKSVFESQIYSLHFAIIAGEVGGGSSAGTCRFCGTTDNTGILAIGNVCSESECQVKLVIISVLKRKWYDLGYSKYIFWYVLWVLFGLSRAVTGNFVIHFPVGENMENFSTTQGNFMKHREFFRTKFSTLFSVGLLFCWIGLRGKVAVFIVVTGNGGSSVTPRGLVTT